jgi:hypothetical protein
MATLAHSNRSSVSRSAREGKSRRGSSQSRPDLDYRSASRHHAFVHHAFVHHAFVHHAFVHHAFVHHAFVHHAFVHHAFVHHAFMHHGFMLRRLVVVLFAVSACLVAAPVLADALGPVEGEQRRLREHFDRVEEELSQRDTSTLALETASKRLEVIAELRRYAEAGVFPRNDGHAFRRQPYFIDQDGRTCAVAHLMVATGYVDEAMDLARHQNTAYVHDMESDGLSAWLQTHGLSVDEAALIQPGYCGCPNEEVPVCDTEGNSHYNECSATLCSQAVVASCGMCAGDDTFVGTTPLNGNQTLAEYCELNDCTCSSDPDENEDGVINDGCGMTGRCAPPTSALWLLAMFLVWRRRSATRRS